LRHSARERDSNSLHQLLYHHSTRTLARPWSPSLQGSVQRHSLNSGIFDHYYRVPVLVSQNDYKADNKYINLDIDFFEAFALPLLAYLSHQNLCRIQSELIGKTQDRMNKVISRSVIIMCILFTTISFFAYMSLLGNTPNIVIMRKAPDSIENDWAMVVCRCLISLTLTIGVPLQLNPCRLSIEKLCFDREGETPLWL